jgi:hypothetical protein
MFRKFSSISTSPLKLCTRHTSVRQISALEGEVTDTSEFDTVTDEIRKWSSLSADECQRFVEDGVLNEFEMM